MITLAFVSQKGGAGKSTIAANIAAYAASNGIKTVIIDLDQQASISAWHGARQDDLIHLIPSHPPLLERYVSQCDPQNHHTSLQRLLSFLWLTLFLSQNNQAPSKSLSFDRNP